MQAHAAPPLEVRFHRLEMNYNWARAIAVLALIGLIAIGGWVALDRLSVPGGQTVLANVSASWTGNDQALFETTYAEDAVFVNGEGTEYKGRDALRGLSTTMRAYGFKAEVAGPIVQSGRTIMAPFHLTWTATGDEAWVTGLFELNSAGLVVRHQDYGTYGD